jgi:copper chaperone CopZ
MRFSSWKQILVLTVAWAAVLFVVDYVKNPRAVSELFGRRLPESTHTDKPHLSIWMNHLCCSGCAGEVQDALKGVPGLGKSEVAEPPKSATEAEQLAPGETSYANHVEVEVTDVKQLDFVALERALEATGLAAERLDFSGVSHFRVEATLKHVCCGACSKALESGLDIAKSLRATGQFAWMDSVSVNKEKRAVIAHARYDKVVDVAELSAALHRMGFAPATLRVLVGSEI